MSAEGHHDSVVGIDIGGTKIAAAVVNADATLAYRAETATPARAGANTILDAVAALVTEIASRTGAAPAAYGVGSAGAFDESGRVVHATNHLAGWRGTDVAGGLRTRLGRPVVVANDVHAAAVGEGWAADDLQRFLFVAIGTGIGGAVFSDGKLLRGASGMAGSVGHLRAPFSRGRTCSCGGIDHIEAFASGPGMERSFALRSGRPLGLREIGRLAIGGDLLATETIDSAARELGASLAASIVITDPGTLVIGGGVAQLGAVFLNPLRDSLRMSLQDPFTRTVTLAARTGPDAAILGAGKLAQGLIRATGGVR